MLTGVLLISRCMLVLSQHLHGLKAPAREGPLRTHCIRITVTLPVQIDRLPVFYKQRDALFFPTWAYVVPTNLGRIPVSFLETTIWVGKCMLKKFHASLSGWVCVVY